MTESNLTSAAEMLERAQARLNRLTPRQAEAAVRAGALLIDIRPASERHREGMVPGAKCIERNVLEWRCDPSSEWADPEAVADPQRPVILMCTAGYQSSLAAATLQRFGLEQATDVIGGFEAWREEGLSVEAVPDEEPTEQTPVPTA
ncbi:MAG TPA: rhodanese-like domain-containing protein, partial [Solirubrobacteraceae bacterium]|nr:rhodanese-like domain-containing protein [Solirubrobacteraceae bacterium]